jgi:hypothetical protein
VFQGAPLTKLIPPTVGRVAGFREDSAIGAQEEPAGFRRKLIAWRVLGPDKVGGLQTYLYLTPDCVLTCSQSCRARGERSIPGAIYHVMDRGDRREDVLLIGTAKGTKSLLHHLAHEPPQHQSASINKADGQPKLQSTG